MRVILILLMWPAFMQAQVSLPLSKYGLPVAGDPAVYRDLVESDADHELVDVRELLPRERYEITYATTENFLKRRLYPAPEFFLRRPAAKALMKAARRLHREGLGLVLYDGYRPYSVTVTFYEEIGDTTFVADPRKGSKHNRGMAVDLSLYDLRTGQLLPMPSAYDEASPRAWHRYDEGDPQALRNRARLKEAMVAAGFEVFPYEWWHYDYRGWQSCVTYDLTHEQIRRINTSIKKSTGR